MNKDVLYDLGFTKGEVEVYLALLKIGQSSIGKIVEVSRVTKSKVYDILNKLKNKGVVSSSVKDGVQFFNAAAPQFLLELVEREEEEIEKTKIELEEMLPSLIDLQTEASKQQRTEIFEGFRGLKNAFQVAANEFKKGEEFLVFGVDNVLNAQQLRFFVDYHKKRVQAKVKTKVIFTANLRGVDEYHQKPDPYNEERFLDQTSAIPINIYKDIVIIPLLEKREKETTILIRNERLAKGLRQFFYTLWDISKP